MAVPKEQHNHNTFIFIGNYTRDKPTIYIIHSTTQDVSVETMLLHLFHYQSDHTTTTRGNWLKQLQYFRTPGLEIKCLANRWFSILNVHSKPAGSHVLFYLQNGEGVPIHMPVIRLETVENMNFPSERWVRDPILFLVFLLEEYALQDWSKHWSRHHHHSSSH